MSVSREFDDFRRADGGAYGVTRPTCVKSLERSADSPVRANFPARIARTRLSALRLGLGLLLPFAVGAAQFKFPEQTFTVPDGFEVEKVAGSVLVERPVSADFDEQG